MSTCQAAASAFNSYPAIVLLCLKYLGVSVIHDCLSLLHHLPSRPPLLHSISGVLSLSLSVVLGVEEDQSESASAHAWHEGGTHHPAFGADQVDQENDWWDHRMSAEQQQEEYIKKKRCPWKRSLKTKLIILMNFCTSMDHSERGELLSPSVFFCWSTWCKLLRYWPTTEVV